MLDDLPDGGQALELGIEGGGIGLEADLEDAARLRGGILGGGGGAAGAYAANAEGSGAEAEGGDAADGLSPGQLTVSHEVQNLIERPQILLPHGRSSISNAAIERLHVSPNSRPTQRPHSAPFLGWPWGTPRLVMHMLTRSHSEYRQISPK